MSTSVLAVARDLLTPELIAKAAGYIGESSESTSAALHALAPAMVGAFAASASTTDGATGLFHLLGSLPKGLDSSDIGGWMQAGKPILSAIFGERLGGLVDVVANASGVRQAGAASLAGMAGSMVASVLAGKAKHSDPTALADLLGGERGRAMAAAPAGVTSVLEDGGFSFRHILPMIFMGIVLLAVPFLYRSCERAPEVHHEMIPVMVEAPKAEKIDLPGGLAINVLPGTINYELAKFLASSDPVPRTFVFDHLNFVFGKTVITEESAPTLNDLVSILKAYPGVDVRLEGHTDSVGNPEENKKLSTDRAAAIAAVLVRTGVAAKRIETAGYGQEKPMASNDTDEGRAKNRRLELVVVKK